MAEISTLPHHFSWVWEARSPEENYSGVEINQFSECITAEGISGWGERQRENNFVLNGSRVWTPVNISQRAWVLSLRIHRYLSSSFFSLPPSWQLKWEWKLEEVKETDCLLGNEKTPNNQPKKNHKQLCLGQAKCSFSWHEFEASCCCPPFLWLPMDREYFLSVVRPLVSEAATTLVAYSV